MSQANRLRHVAIIPDGNGRWAKKRLLPRAAGHHAGAEAVRKIVELSVANQLEALTFFAMSVENFHRRPPHEVHLLLELFLDSLENNLDELDKKNVRLRVVGDRSSFNEQLLQKIIQSEAKTAANTGLQLIMALNYSGRWDLAQAAQRLAQQVLNGQLRCEEVNEQALQNQLCLADLPEPDLLIRTSGEQRISNFMLWQFAYTELYFTNMYWPDFNQNAFQQALDFYYSKQRRFGRTSEQVDLQYA